MKIALQIILGWASAFAVWKFHVVTNYVGVFIVGFLVPFFVSIVYEAFWEK